MPHLEAVELARLDVPQPNVLDPSVGRAAAKVADHLLDRLLLALDMRLDAAVGAVAHPAGDSKLLCLIDRPGAEEDASARGL